MLKLIFPRTYSESLSWYSTEKDPLGNAPYSSTIPYIPFPTCGIKFKCGASVLDEFWLANLAYLLLLRCGNIVPSLYSGMLIRSSNILLNRTYKDDYLSSPILMQFCRFVEYETVYCFKRYKGNIKDKMLRFFF